MSLTCYRPGDGPYERWELTVEETGELLLSGVMPIDENAVRQAVAEYRARPSKAD